MSGRLVDTKRVRVFAGRGGAGALAYAHSAVLFGGGDLNIFRKPLLGCIEADFCEQRRVLQHIQDLHDRHAYAPSQT